MKKQLISGGLVVALSLVGCQAGNDNEGAMNGNNDGANGIEQTGYHDIGDGMTGNRNYNMQRNADGFQNRDNENNVNRHLNNGLNRQNYNTQYNQMDSDNDNITNNNMNNDNNANNNRVNDNSNEDRYNVASEAADKIKEQVDQIEGAYVFTTENNAYVAAELDANDNNNQNNTNNEDRFDDELSNDVKEKVSDIVKSVDQDIDNVYVSTNPDFFELSNNYADDVDQGEPVEGFFDQFSNMVERIFPQNR